MGAGKSVVGKKLANVLKKRLTSIDELIIQKDGKSINAIFQASGEDYFRKIEKEMIKEACQQSNIIIDCGGGAILDSGNVSTLKENGIVFYLSAPVEVLYQRIKDQGRRPLLNVDDAQSRMAELLQKRSSLYEQSADHVIDTTNKFIEEVAKEIQNLV